MFTQNRANNFSAKAQFLMKESLIDVEPLEYNIQDFQIPSTTLNPVTLNKSSTSGNIPGDSIIQEQSVTLEFILDEELEVLFALQKIQVNNSLTGRSEDTFVANILNHKNKIIAIGSFQKAWIESIGNIQYSTKGEELTIFLPVTISYLNFNLERP